MDELKLFIPITKVDAAQRLVYGVATAEKPDVSGEVCDYASTKPYYEKWSGDIAKVTEGKSFGNLRAMHGNVAAGKLTSINFNDDARQIEICGKVVDDAEWAKVEEGVYTGFSQGGKYIKRWKDEAGLQRYTAEPIEVSLVDLPCLPDATFSVIKADGSTELRKFKPAESVTVKFVAVSLPSNGDIAVRATELAKAAGNESKWADFIGAATTELMKAATPAAAATAETTAVAIPHGAVEADDGSEEQGWRHKMLPGEFFKTKGEMRKRLIEKAAETAAKTQAAPVMDALAGIKDSLTKRESGGDATTAPAGKTVVKVDQQPAGDGMAKKDYSDDERKQGAKEGWAKKDGSYPIKTAKDVANAVKDWIRSKGSASDKRHIIKRAKAVSGGTDELPPDWSGSTKDKDAKKLALAGDGAAVQKNLYFVSNLVALLASLEQFEEDYEMITRWGAADPERNELCTRFGTVLVDCADLVADILDRAIAGITAEEQGEADGAIQRASILIDLHKINGVYTLAKAGAKHAKADKERIAQAHDLLVELDPDCCDAAEDGDMGETEKLNKVLTAERSEFKKVLDSIAVIVTDVAERVKKIEDQPLPIGSTSVRVVDKSIDSSIAGNAGTVLEQPGALEALAEAAIRKAQSRPMSAPPGFHRP